MRPNPKHTPGAKSTFKISLMNLSRLNVRAAVPGNRLSHVFAGRNWPVLKALHVNVSGAALLALRFSALTFLALTGLFLLYTPRKLWYERWLSPTCGDSNNASAHPQ